MANIIFTPDVSGSLASAISEASPDRIFTLSDENTARLCLPLISDCPGIDKAESIVIPQGDANKTIATAETVWKALASGGATRHSLLVNVGGGMTTDLGGFAAAAFKRGIAFINVPTTLLAMVDASAGGKTGVNFCGLKNEIGFFRDADAVIIDTRFLATLDQANLTSGYAEMLKHSLLDGVGTWAAHLSFDIAGHPDLGTLAAMVEQSVGIKLRVVSRDPHEHSIRKALNLGHTIGHAIESLAMGKGSPILHGHAVAWGLVGELFLSAVECGFPGDRLAQTARFIRENYPAVPLNCHDYQPLLSLMRHDKKNIGGQIRFTLLSDVGQIQLDRSVTEASICDALDYIIQG